VIRLSDDSGINEKFLSLTTGEKYRNTEGIRINGLFYPNVPAYAPLNELSNKTWSALYYRRNTIVR